MSRTIALHRSFIKVVGEQLAEVDWETVLDKVGNKCNKLSRMSLFAFGRAFGVSGYALSPLLFYAEFSSLPQHIAHHVHRLVFRYIHIITPLI